MSTFSDGWSQELADLIMTSKVNERSTSIFNHLMERMSHHPFPEDETVLVSGLDGKVSLLIPVLLSQTPEAWMKKLFESFEMQFFSSVEEKWDLIGHMVKDKKAVLSSMDFFEQNSNFSFKEYPNLILGLCTDASFGREFGREARRRVGFCSALDAFNASMKRFQDYELMKEWVLGIMDESTVEENEEFLRFTCDSPVNKKVLPTLNRASFTLDEKEMLLDLTLEYGVNPRSCGIDGKTPMRVLITNGFFGLMESEKRKERLIQKLIQYGAKLEDSRPSLSEMAKQLNMETFFENIREMEILNQDASPPSSPVKRRTI